MANKAVKTIASWGR